MPIARSLMENLQRQYGEKKGEQVYYAMEGAGTGPFAPGGKYRHLHERFAEKNGLAPSKAVKSKGTKKPRRSGKRRG